MVLFACCLGIDHSEQQNCRKHFYEHMRKTAKKPPTPGDAETIDITKNP